MASAARQASYTDLRTAEAAAGLGSHGTGTADHTVVVADRTVVVANRTAVVADRTLTAAGRIEAAACYAEPVGSLSSWVATEFPAPKGKLGGFETRRQAAGLALKQPQREVGSA